MIWFDLLYLTSLSVIFQPSDVPFKSMGFDGSIYVDTHVNFSRPRSLHYSVQGLFYFTHDTGVLFHYSTELAGKND
jgi:hypothetical protein